MRLFVFSIILLVIAGCAKEKATPDYAGFPDDVGRILVTKCAVPGCHDAQSKQATSGLDLTSWDEMFKGNNGGAVTIPYRPDQSILLFSINTYPELGLVLPPSMPFNEEPLSYEEVQQIADWIAAGAPDRDGNVKFADDPDRRKIYVANQGCDLVTVLDAETYVQMRYIDIGKTQAVESPHMIKISPDGKYWYVIYLNSNVLQRYRTSDDSFVDEAIIGAGYWNTFAISSDGNYAYCVDWSANGKIAKVDLQAMALSEPLWQGLFVQPHGSWLHPSDDTLYVTGQVGNFIYKVPVNDPLSTEMISLQTGVAPTTNPAVNLDPHEVTFSPDGTRYFVTCQASNEVRVMNAANDSLIAVIPTGGYPLEMSISLTTNYMFVACEEETTLFPGKRGAVTIIDYVNHTAVKTIHSGFQPHGIAADDVEGKCYVANRNVSAEGPAPHHSSACAGKNGYITVIDYNTLEIIPGSKIELSVDPYSVALRN